MKAKQKAPQAKRQRASGPKAPTTAPEARQSENAAQRQARVEAAFVATGKKRLAHSAHSIREVEQLEKDRDRLQHKLGRDRDGGRVAQWEKDKRTVLQALGHDADGKCPASDETSLERWTFFANHHLPQMNPDEFYSGPACGWLWCHKRDGFKNSTWADLLKALEVLRGKDIKPTAPELVDLANKYAEGFDWRKMWDALAFNKMDAVIASNPAARVFFDPQLLRQLESAKQAGAGKKDVPMRDFLVSVKAHGWPPAVAAAILFLFGLTEDGERYSTVKNRVAVADQRV